MKFLDRFKKKEEERIVVNVHMADDNMLLVKSEEISKSKFDKFVVSNEIANWRCRCKIVNITYDMDNGRFSLELTGVWTNDRNKITWYSGHLDNMFD